MSAIEITRQDFSISQLRLEAARTAKQARRILAIAMVLDEHPRLLAAQAGGMDRPTLRDWVHRYNADGLAALGERRSLPASLVRCSPKTTMHAVGSWGALYPSELIFPVMVETRRFASSPCR